MIVCIDYPIVMRIAGRYSFVDILLQAEPLGILAGVEDDVVGRDDVALGGIALAEGVLPGSAELLRDRAKSVNAQRAAMMSFFMDLISFVYWFVLWIPTLNFI